jgi:hypothetical protein
MDGPDPGERTAGVGWSLVGQAVYSHADGQEIRENHKNHHEGVAMSYRLMIGDAMEQLRTLPNESAKMGYER